MKITDEELIAALRQFADYRATADNMSSVMFRAADRLEALTAALPHMGEVERIAKLERFLKASRSGEEQNGVRAEAAEAERDRMKEALNCIDALDPEEHLFGVSHDACRGLVGRMGQIARAALNGGADDIAGIEP